MKKFLTLFTCLLFASVTEAQYVNIPDSGLKVMLKGLYPACFNANDEMDTTCNAIITEDSLDVGVFANNAQPIYKLDGIQYFKSLIAFGCKNCLVDTLRDLPSTLKRLYCDGALNLQTVFPFPSTLELLDITHCPRIRSLPSLPASLKWFYCGFSNMLDSLPALPDGLILLDISQSMTPVNFTSYPDSLRFLNTSINENVRHSAPFPPKLKRLECRYNFIDRVDNLPDSLEYLDLTDNFNILSLPALPGLLKEMYVSRMSLNGLPALPDSLKILNCSGNFIRQLPSLPGSLTDLNCSANYLQHLPALPLSLKNLDCSYDSLLSLPSLHQGLKTVNCKSNLLSVLPALPSSLLSMDCRLNNIYCIPSIPATLTAIRIYVDGQKVTCIPNTTSRLLLYKDDRSAPAAIALCNPVNNLMHCQGFPVMQGTIFYDNNNNNIIDTNEPAAKNICITLSNGSYSFSDTAGRYEIGNDTIGNCTVSAAPPIYFATVPVSYQYNFTGYDTLVTGNFALQPTITINELSVKIIPVSWAARPGFAFTYMISYQNTGTTNLSPVITFTYDSVKLVYDSGSAGVIAQSNNMLSFNPGNLLTGQDGNFLAFFTIKTDVVLGDSIHSEAMIRALNYEVADTNSFVIRGSYDPNDKQATPQLSPLQVSNGEYIDYTVRFQNTGTDTAFTVVISDTLSYELQTNSLQMIASSHNCKTTVKDNIVFFEFLNILLPDSNINEPLSHGFVSFRVKPKPTVAVNTVIPNKAAIYFDYNAPVITNTAGTLIKDFTVVPLKLISFSAVPQNDNTISLYWNTANEINTQQFAIERSNDGSHFNSLTNVPAKGKANNNYNATIADANTGIVFYRLKIIDNDGSFVYSPIVKIDRRKSTPGITILSNPVKDFIIISTAGRSLYNTQAGIINMQGAVIKTFTLKEGSQTIDLGDLPPGIYYLRTTVGNEKFLLR